MNIFICLWDCAKLRAAHFEPVDKRVMFCHQVLLFLNTLLPVRHISTAVTPAVQSDEALHRHTLTALSGPHVKCQQVCEAGTTFSLKFSADVIPPWLPQRLCQGLGPKQLKAAAPALETYQYKCDRLAVVAPRSAGSYVTNLDAQPWIEAEISTKQSHQRDLQFG